MVLSRFFDRRGKKGSDETASKAPPKAKSKALVTNATPPPNPATTRRASPDLPLLSTPSDLFRLSACTPVDVTRKADIILRPGQDPRGKSYATCTVYHPGFSLDPTSENVSTKVLVSLDLGPKWYAHYVESFKGLYSPDPVQVNTLHRIGGWHFFIYQSAAMRATSSFRVLLLIYSDQVTVLESCPIPLSFPVVDIVQNSQNLASVLERMYIARFDKERELLSSAPRSRLQVNYIAIYQDDNILIYTTRGMPRAARYKVEWKRFPQTLDKDSTLPPKYLHEFHRACQKYDAEGVISYRIFGTFLFMHVHEKSPRQAQITYIAQVSSDIIESLSEDTKTAVFRWLHHCNVNPRYHQEQGYPLQKDADDYPYVWLENHGKTSFLRHRTVNGVHHFEFRFHVKLAYTEGRWNLSDGQRARDLIEKWEKWHNIKEKDRESCVVNLISEESTTCCTAFRFDTNFEQIVSVWR